jgi:hypothetical protein
MIKKQLLNPNRVRKIQGSFAFIEHRFLRNGFYNNLTQHEIVLYLFLIMAADRQGLSYYSYDKICKHADLILDEYILARDGLIDKELIAFDGFFFQVLSLPEKSPVPTVRNEERKNRDFVAVAHLISNLSAEKGR